MDRSRAGAYVKYALEGGVAEKPSFLAWTVVGAVVLPRVVLDGGGERVEEKKSGAMDRPPDTGRWQTQWPTKTRARDRRRRAHNALAWRTHRN